MISATVVGAGPAGLAAALTLAGHGVSVTVLEQHAQVGARFHGDFQGYENWTTETDVLAWLGTLGITLGCPFQPVSAVTLVDPALRPWPVRADRPLLYLVQRGPGEQSLDRSLRAQAEAAGVRIRFGRRARLDELSGPVIVATGPRGAQAVVAGIIADTPHADQVVAIAANTLAPKCYAYAEIWNGRATLATALADRFDQAWPCFERARRVHDDGPHGVLQRAPLRRARQHQPGSSARGGGSPLRR